MARIHEIQAREEAEREQTKPSQLIGRATRVLRQVIADLDAKLAVRDAFTRLGHDAVSCDLLPSDAVTGRTRIS